MACLAKMKVYLEDDASSEIVVNNVSYRKIGELKNGEEKVRSDLGPYPRARRRDRTGA